MADVFISYKSEEFDDANWVKAALETNGISCWMAPMCIPGGSSYAVEIPKAIRTAKVFVLILSENSQQSKWVPRELDQAINEGKTILPFMLENCKLKDDFNFYLSNVQRYAAYQNKSAAIKKMIKQIQAILGTTDVEEPKNETSEPEKIVEKNDIKDEKIDSEPSIKKDLPKKTKQVKIKKQKNKKTKWLWAMIIAAIIFVNVVGNLIVNISNSSIVIAGKEFHKLDSSVTIEGQTLSENDIDSLSDFNELSSICLTDCKIPSNALQTIFAAAKYRVELVRCGITNDMLSRINLISLSDTTIYEIKLDGNDKLTDLKPLSAFGEKLHDLSFNDCSVSDISFVKDLTNLQELYFNGNGVKDISPLSNCKKIGRISANSNALTTLNGLEQCISLKELYVKNNKITSIEGVKNTTLLENVNLSGNQISDIKLLAKSKDSLITVDVSNNNIKDIGALNGCVLIKKLSIANNQIESLGALSKMSNLTTIDASNNKINDITSISNCKKLVSADLANNSIVDPSSLTFDPSATWVTLDLSHNRIMASPVLPNMKYRYLALYGNNISDLNSINKTTGSTLAFDYNSSIDFKSLGDSSYIDYYIIDCPLDQQVSIGDILGSYGTHFVTEQEFIKAMKEIN